jgi:endonuclease YncB( thermonuclease family)
MSYQIELLRVEDSRARQALQKKAEREGLSRQELRELIRTEKAKGERGKPFQPRSLKSVALLVPQRGIPGTYRIKSAEEIGWPVPGMLFLDNGFRSYKALTAQEAKGLKAGDIVEISGAKLVKSARTEKDLYMYPAYFTKGIDGDTFWMTLDRGRGDAALQKLRLRGIDCPELNTPEGIAAKKFVESVLKAASSITVRSSKNDNHDRFEADVFFKDSKGQEVYLNNLLLEKGHAVPMPNN